MPQLSETRYSLLTDELALHIAQAPDEEQAEWLILEDHPDFVGHWIVNCLDPAFLFDFEELIGPYRALSPRQLPAFLDLCDEKEYRVVFAEPPENLLERLDHLNDEPPFALTSNVPGTVAGFYPWQLQGFNFLKDQPGGKAIWSTGTGKTALAGALIKYHVEVKQSVNLVFYTAKVHNRVNTQRKLLKLAGVDSIILDSYKVEKRAALYADLYRRLEAGERLVLITNYEKFREDEVAIKALVAGRDCMILWDEMPTKLSNRDTLLYQAVLRTIWKTEKDKDNSIPNPKKSKLRMKSYIGYELTATPIENDPEGDFNCTRLVRPDAFPSVTDWRAEFVQSYSFFDEYKPERFHKLDKFALMQSHITHVVNKKDPDIAPFFPKVLYEPRIIDWDPADRKTYDLLTGKAEQMIEGLEEANVLAMIGVMQMLCDAPTMINESAVRRAEYEIELARWQEDETDREPDRRGSSIALELALQLGTLSNERHAKHKVLKELLTEKHPDEHVLVYTAFGPMLLPLLSQRLDEWGVSHVVYSGTAAAKQRAYDAYRTGDYQVWLSSDAGADSIDLELATVGIDFDLPWKYTTRVQRWNRANRAGAVHEAQTFYSLLMANSIEDRKLQIIEKKQSYHEGVYEGKLNDQAATARMNKDDFLYILFGNR